LLLIESGKKAFDQIEIEIKKRGFNEEPVKLQIVSSISMPSLMSFLKKFLRCEKDPKQLISEDGFLISQPSEILEGETVIVNFEDQDSSLISKATTKTENSEEKNRSNMSKIKEMMELFPNIPVTKIIDVLEKNQNDKGESVLELLELSEEYDINLDSAKNSKQEIEIDFSDEDSDEDEKEEENFVLMHGKNLENLDWYQQAIKDEEEREKYLKMETEDEKLAKKLQYSNIEEKEDDYDEIFARKLQESEDQAYSEMLSKQFMDANNKDLVDSEKQRINKMYGADYDDQRTHKAINSSVSNASVKKNLNKKWLL